MTTDVGADGRTGIQQWRDGGRLTAGGMTWTAPGMQTLYDTVRAAGANNVVLVDGTGWAANLLPAGRIRLTAPTSRTPSMPTPTRRRPGRLPGDP